MNDEVLEQAAAQIAQHGRDALVARLRPAFEEAAAAHADVLEIGPEQLESMVQEAADSADGLQWRRALAAVASEELGISLGEALGHPVLTRAQEIAGAPSYEESLASLDAAVRETGPSASAGSTGGPAGAAGAGRPAGAAGAGQPASAAGDNEAGGPQAPAPPDQSEQTTQHAAQATQQPEQPAKNVRDTQPPEIFSPPLRLPAIHLAGIAKLSPGQGHITLRLSEQGLDIVRGSSDGALGRLRWEDISALEVPDARGRLRRRQKKGGAHLLIRARRGDASFEIPSLAPDQLRARLAPALERLRR